MDLTYWYLFPIAIAIAFLANGAGIGGATFFTPLFILVLGLEPQVAVGVALITEVFGFASGVSAHARARTIDWKVARMLAVVSVPAAIVGSLVAGFISPDVLKILLGLGLLVIAVAFIRHSDVQPAEHAVHLLEHGAVWITHRSDLTAEQVDRLRRFTGQADKVIVSPVPGQTSPVLATAWANQLELSDADDSRLEQFVNEFEGSLDAPEPGGACRGGVGTPVG